MITRVPTPYTEKRTPPGLPVVAQERREVLPGVLQRRKGGIEVSTVPAPLEWHPAYRDRTWLIDWLERRGEYADRQHMRILFTRPLRVCDLELTEPEELEATVMVLTRRRCFGLAPWVGDPFHYEWWVGEDNVGRCIAGDARIVYDEWHPLRTPKTLEQFQAEYRRGRIELEP